MRKSGEELAAWRLRLRGLAPQLLEALEPWLVRVAQFFGPYPNARPAHDGEPQGYLGIASRGPFERLLVSEWALLMASPREFQRRAISGEQLYFELARESADADRRCIVLVDSGPYQLGNPRLAQLAILTVLAERAQAASHEFFWSSWQAEPGAFETSFEAASVERFLALRSASTPQRERVAHWLEALGPPDAGAETWSIGAEPVVLRDKRFHHVSIGENDFEPAAAMKVAWHAPGGTESALELPLLPERARVRLLRAPYETMPQTQQAGERLYGAHFGPGCERLIARTAAGLTIYHLPHDTDQKAGRTRSFALLPEEELVAAGCKGAWILVVLKCRGEVHLHRVQREEERDPKPFVSIDPGVAAWPGGRGLGICVSDPQAPKQRFFFSDASACVHILDRTTLEVQAPLDRVSFLFCLGREVHVSSAVPERLQARFQQGTWEVLSSQEERVGLLRAFIGPGFEFRPQPVTAYEVDENVWLVGAQIMRPGPWGRVVGVAGNGAARAAGLLVIEADGRTLIHLGLRFNTTLLHAKSAILGVALAIERRWIAVWTEGKGLEVISLDDGHGRVLCEEEA